MIYLLSLSHRNWLNQEILGPDWPITSHVTYITSSDWLFTCIGRFLLSYYPTDDVQYFKDDRTLCNEGTQVCLKGTCTESLCVFSNTTSCQVSWAWVYICFVLTWGTVRQDSARQTFIHMLFMSCLVCTYHFPTQSLIQYYYCSRDMNISPTLMYIICYWNVSLRQHVPNNLALKKCNFDLTS